MAKRTAEEILTWLEPIFMCESDIAKLPEDQSAALAAGAAEVVEKINAACMLGFSGRVALEAAMGAVIVKRGEAAPKLTGIQLLEERYEHERFLLPLRGDRLTSLNVNQAMYLKSDDGSDSERESLVRIGCAAALLLEDWVPSNLDAADEPMAGAPYDGTE